MAPVIEEISEEENKAHVATHSKYANGKATTKGGKTGKPPAPPTTAKPAVNKKAAPKEDICDDDDDDAGPDTTATGRRVSK